MDNWPDSLPAHLRHRGRANRVEDVHTPDRRMQTRCPNPSCHIRPHQPPDDRSGRPVRSRRLMLGEGLDAARAAYRVGYHDAAYFNREYKSLFGLPPMRDVERLREVASESISLAADW
jgi:hypothetical protein